MANVRSGQAPILVLKRVKQPFFQIIYNAHEKSCKELLNVSNDISVHQKHFRILAIEV